MRRLLTFILLASFMVGCGEPQTDSATEIVLTEGLRFNESAFPYKGDVLIANFGTEVRNPMNSEGKGYISILKDGAISTLIPADGSLSAPKGMLVKDNYLVVCDVNRLVCYNLSDLSLAPQILDLPEGEPITNDIALSGDYMYVSVTNTGNIYKIDASDLSQFSSASPEVWYNVVGANGLLIEGSAMYVASYSFGGEKSDDNVVYQIPNIEEPVASKLITRSGLWDGLAISADKKTLYAGSWDPVEMVAIDIATSAVNVIEMESKLVGPADFIVMDGTLYLPDLVESTMIIKKL